MITRSRQLEGIVPAEYKKTFSLYQEEEPMKFNLSAAPKPNSGEAEDDMSAAPEAPMDSPPDATEALPEDASEKDKSTWLVKKLVGILRYAGAMAIEVRGAVPDEAFEIVDKLQTELESIAASLDPFVTNKEEPEPESEEPEEKPAEEEPTEEPDFSEV